MIQFKKEKLKVKILENVNEIGKEAAISVAQILKQ